VIPNEPDFNDTIIDGRVSLFDTKEGEGSYNSDLTVNLPISETLAIRGSVYSLQNGGYIDNVYEGPANNSDEDYNREKINGGRFTLLWEPNDSTQIKFTQLYQDSHADGRPDEYRANDPLEGLGLNSRTSNGGNILFPNEQVGISDELQVAKFVDETFDDEFAVSSFQVDKTFDTLSLTSITSYMSRDFENRR